MVLADTYRQKKSAHRVPIFCLGLSGGQSLHPEASPYDGQITLMRQPLVLFFHIFHLRNGKACAGDLGYFSLGGGKEDRAALTGEQGEIAVAKYAVAL